MEPTRMLGAKYTLISVLAVVLFFFLTLSPASALGFSDVSPGDWFSQAVQELAGKGIITGFPDGTFRPYEPVTRAQFVAMLVRTLGLVEFATQGALQHSFEDISPSDWFAVPVAAAYQAGLVAGVSETSFAPYGRVSREQAVTFVVRGLKRLADVQELPPISVSVDTELWLRPFQDRLYISEVHRESVALAYRAGIVSGFPEGCFYPFFPITRAQAVGLLQRAFMGPLEMKTEPEPEMPALYYPELSEGASGDLVRFLEERLAELSYAVGAIDGRYDEATRTGVMAFQKVEGLPRTGVCTAATLQKLLEAAPPTLRYSGQGDWVEIDLTRQVLFLVRGGVLVKTLPISSGQAGMSTPTGQYRILYKAWGWVKSPLGWMYSPSYFRSSYAIHGSSSVPPWPASHGCVRTPVWATDELAKELRVGLAVYIYY